MLAASAGAGAAVAKHAVGASDHTVAAMVGTTVIGYVSAAYFFSHQVRRVRVRVCVRACVRVRVRLCVHRTQHMHAVGMDMSH